MSALEKPLQSVVPVSSVHRPFGLEWAEPAPLHLIRDVLRDVLESAPHAGFVDLLHADRRSGPKNRYGRDARAHEAAAQHADLGDLLRLGDARDPGRVFHHL